MRYITTPILDIYGNLLYATVDTTNGHWKHVRVSGFEAEKKTKEENDKNEKGVQDE